MPNQQNTENADGAKTKGQMLAMWLGLPAACLAAATLGIKTAKLIGIDERVQRIEPTIERMAETDTKLGRDLGSIASRLELLALEIRKNNDAALSSMSAIAAGFSEIKAEFKQLGRESVDAAQASRIATAASQNALSQSDELDKRIRRVEIEQNGKSK